MARLRQQIERQYDALAPTDLLEGEEGDFCDVVCGPEDHFETVRFCYQLGKWRLIHYREDWVP